MLVDSCGQNFILRKGGKGVRSREMTESQAAGKPGIWLNRRSLFTAGLLGNIILLRTYICKTGHASGVKILRSSGLQAGEYSERPALSVFTWPKTTPKNSNPTLGKFLHPLLLVDVVGVADAILDAPNVPLVPETFVTEPALAPSVVAPAPVQLVTVVLAVVTPPSYKLQVKTAPLIGVARPPGLFVNGLVRFLGIVAALKNWSFDPEPGEIVKL
jgi:hypothetical protein